MASQAPCQREGRGQACTPRNMPARSRSRLATAHALGPNTVVTAWEEGLPGRRAVVPLMHPHTPASPAAGLQVPTSIPPSRQPLPSEQHILGSLPRPPREALAVCPTLTTAVPPLDRPSLGVLSSRPPFPALSTSWRYLLHLSACLLPGGEHSGQSRPLAQDGGTPLSVGSPAA